MIANAAMTRDARRPLADFGSAVPGGASREIPWGRITAIVVAE